MRLVSCIFFAFTVLAGSGVTFGAEEPETSHLAFVTEYVRELAANENFRALGEQEVKEGAKRFAGFIHSGTLIQLELRSQIRMLKGMHMNPPFEDIIPDVIAMYEYRITFL